MDHIDIRSYLCYNEMMSFIQRPLEAPCRDMNPEELPTPYVIYDPRNIGGTAYLMCARFPEQSVEVDNSDQKLKSIKIIPPTVPQMNAGHELNQRVKEVACASCYLNPEATDLCSNSLEGTME